LVNGIKLTFIFYTYFFLPPHFIYTHVHFVLWLMAVPKVQIFCIIAVLQFYSIAKQSLLLIAKDQVYGLQSYQDIGFISLEIICRLLT